ncbi:MAG TPA: cell-division initiation protein [Lachnospiraceae bacterium]|nr:septum formation initiator family protein [Anaerosporobacter sp.]MBS5934044.1 septum formation initiator family protein [Clostridiales bacterium]HAB61303.1 cell-division initiation protein [Lachnospiraceae bacterium]
MSYERKVNRMIIGRKTKKRTGLFTTICLVLMICGIIFYQKESLDKKRMTYQEKDKVLQQQIDAETERAEEIEERRAYVQTKKYIEEVAREKLGLVYEDEIILDPGK